MKYVALMMSLISVLAFPEIYTLGHHGPVLSVGMSIDGRIAVSGGGWPDPTVKVWDIGTGDILSTLSFGNRYNVVALTQDGRYAVIGGDTKALILWNVVDERVERFYLGHTKPITAIVVDPLGMYIASGDESGTVKIWRLGGRGLYKNFFAHKGKVTDLSFSQDGQFLASSSVDGTVIVWKGFYRYPIKTIKVSKPVLSVCVSSAGDGSVLVITGDSAGELTFWRLVPKVGEFKILVPYELEKLKSVRAHSGAVLDVIVSPDGSKAVSVGSDGYVKVWDPEKLKLERSLGRMFSPSSSVSITLDGRVLVSDLGGNMKLWDSSTGMVIRIFEGSPIVTDMDARKDLIVASYRDGTVKVFQKDGKLLKVFHEHAVGDVRVAVTDNGIVSAGRDGRIILYDTKELTVRKVLMARGKPICCIAKDPGGSRVAVVDEFGNMSVWNTETGLLDLFVSTGDEVSSVSLIGDRVFTGTKDGRLIVWSVKKRKETGEVDLKVPVKLIGVDNEGKRLAVFCGDGYVRVLDIGDLKTVATVKPLSRTVTDMELFGEKLYSVGEEDNVEVWNLESGEPEPGLIAEGDSLMVLTIDGSGTVYAGGYTGILYSLSGAELKYFVGFADGEYAIFSDGKLVLSKGLESGMAIGIGMRKKRVEGNIACPTVPKGSKIILDYKRSGLKLTGASVFKDTVYLISEDGYVSVWALKGGKVLRRVKVSERPLTAIDVKGDGILVGDKGGGVYLVSFDGDVEELGKHYGSVKWVGWVDGKPVSAGIDGYLRVWGEEKKEIYVKSLYSVFYGNEKIFIGGNGTVGVVDTGNWKTLGFEKLHDDVVTAVTASNGVVFSGSMDGTLIAWDTESGNTLVMDRSLSNYTVLAVYGGELVGGTILGDLVVFDLKGMKKLKAFRKWDFQVVSIVPYGDRLIVVGENGVVSVVNGNLEEIAGLFIDGSGYMVHTSDGKLILENIDLEETAKFYLVESGKRKPIPSEKLCQVLGIDLTE